MVPVPLGEDAMRFRYFGASLYSVALVAALWCRPAVGADLFSIALFNAFSTFQVPPVQRGFRTATGIPDSLTEASLMALLSGYQGYEPLTAQFSMRGVTGTATFEVEGNILTVIIPRTGISMSFDGGSSRDDAVAQFRAWLLAQSGTLNDMIARIAVRSTPTDPVAGNPGSLMGQMVAADFNRAMFAALGFGRGGGMGGGIGFGFSQFSARGGPTSRTSGIPLNWTFELSPQDELEVDAPISWTETAGANAYAGQLGLLWRRQMSPNWILQPAVRFGGVNANDFGASSGLYQFGVTSTYRFALPWNMRMIVANQVSHAATFAVGLGQYTTNYAQTNTMFRNGIAISRPLGFAAMGEALHATIFVIDTRYIGDPVFIRHYQEIGAFVGGGTNSRAQAGFTILTGDRGTRGFSLRAAWQF